jgi:hypothetical protein
LVVIADFGTTLASLVVDNEPIQMQKLVDEFTTVHHIDDDTRYITNQNKLSSGTKKKDPGYNQRLFRKTYIIM